MTYAYLRSLLHFHTTARSLRSSSTTNLLTILFAHTALGARSFSVTSPLIWNSLPPALHYCNCLNTFHRHLKTHYFQQAFSSPRTSLHVPQFLLTLCASIKFTYLLYVVLSSPSLQQKLARCAWDECGVMAADDLQSQTVILYNVAVMFYTAL